MRTGRSKKRWLLGVMLIGSVVLMTILFSPRERLLLERAKRNSPKGFAGISECRYQWISNRELIKSTWGDKVLFSRYDRVTRQETPLARLNALCPKLDGFPNAAELSANGQWLLWTTEWADKEHQTYTLATDGSHLHQWSGVDGYCAPCWLQDSRRWIAFDANLQDWRSGCKSLHLYQVDAPTTNKNVPIPEYRSLGIDRWSDKLDAAGAFITTNDHLLLNNNWGVDYTPSLNVAEFGISNVLVCLHRYHIRFPPGARLEEFAYAPQGDKIAWLFSFTRVSALQRLWHRLFRSYPLHPYQEEGLWVCKLDGTDWREIGHYVMKAQEQDSNQPDSLQWLPDGKQLSFIYQDALWIVPAE